MTTDHHESFAVPLLMMSGWYSDSTAVPLQHMPLTRGQLGDNSRAPFTHLCHRYRKQDAATNTEHSLVDKPKKATHASEKKAVGRIKTP